MWRAHPENHSPGAWRDLVHSLEQLLPIAQERRNCRNRDLSQHPANWRGWGFRTWRLDRYLANNPVVPLNASEAGKG